MYTFFKAVSGDPKALIFTGGRQSALALLKTKMQGYMQFNRTYPGYGCFTPWVGFAANGSLTPIDAYWASNVPGLDNGEWFWALYAVSSWPASQPASQSAA